MIPRTFPSSVASNGSTQMIVYFLPSVSGLTRWVDYIPVKFTTVATAATENTYNQNGYIPVVSLSSIAGATPFKEYVPVFLDSSAVDADVWDVTITGFIPVGTAGIGGAALYLDFAATTSLDPRITFSRTTNATVTGSNGLIQNAPMNLLTFSEQFDNAAWTKSNATITANATAAPDGTLTADLITQSSGLIGSVSQVAFFTAGIAYSISGYFKQNGVNQLKILLGGTWAAPIEERTVTLSLQTNTIVSAGNKWVSSSLSLTDVGNGWYKFSGTSVPSDLSASVALTMFGGVTAGNGTDGLYIWGAQLNVGTLQSYNPTTVKNLLGFTENFDNAAWTKSNAFVQTNLLTYSQDFDNAAWSKVNSTITANSTTAPDGSATADTFIPTVTAGAVSQTGIVKAAASITYTFSFYAKAAGFTSLRAFVFGSSNANRGDATFDLSNETVSSVASVGSFTNTSATITNANNGWYRCTITTTSDTTTGLAATFRFDGTVNGTSGFFLWGAQLVQGTSAGDYKATYAAAAAVGYTDIYGQPFAQKLVETTAASTTHIVLQVPITVSASALYTLSGYLKAGERKWVQVIDNGASGANAYFNLETGATGAVSAGSTATITAVGNGWYRCALTFTTAVAQTAANIQFRIATANGTSSYTGDGTSGIYIFGAQLSDSASVDPYVYQPVAAPTSTAYYGPRFDYDPVTLAPKGLLIEEQRTNLLTYSEQFDNAFWARIGASIVANTSAAPNGTITADKLVSDTSTGVHVVYKQAVLSSGSFSVSMYAKAGEYSWVSLRDTAAFGAWFNLTTGVIGTQTNCVATIAPVGNGWYRLTVTGAAVVGSGCGAYLANADNSLSFTGDGVSGIFIWGAQVEAGAFATSYIPTVASQVTRAADSASMIGNNFARWFNQTAGSTLVDFNTFATSSLNVVEFNAGQSVNPISLYRETTTWRYRTSLANLNLNGAQFVTNNKTAFVYAASDYVISVNGNPVQTNTGVGSIAPHTQLIIGGAASSFSYGANSSLNGTIKRIAYYPRRLANTELQGITS
jgi:hypothetical protein